MGMGTVPLSNLGLRVNYGLIGIDVDVSVVT